MDTEFDFWNPPTPLSFGNWHAKTIRFCIGCMVFALVAWFLHWLHGFCIGLHGFCIGLYGVCIGCMVFALVCMVFALVALVLHWFALVLGGPGTPWMGQLDSSFLVRLVSRSAPGPPMTNELSVSLKGLEGGEGGSRA